MKVKIVIYRNSLIKSIYADDETNQFIIGDVEIKKGVSDFIKSAIDIIKDWPEKIEKKEKSVDIHYVINYDDGTNTKELSADGHFPDDFYKLSNLIFLYEDPILYRTNLINNKTMKKAGNYNWTL